MSWGDHTNCNKDLNLAWSRITDLELKLDWTEAELASLREALPDPDKLDLLADWFDQDDANQGRTSEPQVQADLRSWAKSARNALKETT